MGNNILFFPNERPVISKNTLAKILVNLNVNPNNMNEKEMTNKIITLIRKRGIKKHPNIAGREILKRTNYKNYVLIEHCNYLPKLREIYLNLKGKKIMNNTEYNFNSNKLKEEILRMHYDKNHNYNNENNNNHTSPFRPNKRRHGTIKSVGSAT